MKVLVLEQDASIRRVLGIAVTEMGYEVETVADLEEALASLNQVWPDALVLNPNAVGEKGFALLEEIRAYFGETPGHVPLSISLQAPCTAETLQRQIQETAELSIRAPVPRIGPRLAQSRRHERTGTAS